MNALIVFFVIPMVLGFWAQHRVKSTFARNLEVSVSNGMTGAQVARHVLDANGLQEVPVDETPGSLSDHYDPRSRSVHLSPHVFHGVSIASTAGKIPCHQLPTSDINFILMSRISSSEYSSSPSSARA
ncbi:MAG: zinc metallopeptidase [Gaiellaceae bacterium]